MDRCVQSFLTMDANKNNTILLSSGRRITLPKGDQDLCQENKKVLVDRVNNVWGSTAGAGSDFFHIYRKHRTREMERLKQLDEQHDMQEEEKQFQQKRSALIQQTLQLHKKKNAKRQKKKLKKMLLKNSKDNINQFENDGNFLKNLLKNETQ